MNRVHLFTLILCAMLVAPDAAPAVECGQTDDFEDGTTQGWEEGAFSPNPPTNVPNGGPAGLGDGYMRDVSSGGHGPGSRMAVYNRAQWAGDYLSAGVTRIEVDLANFGATAMAIRVGVEFNLNRFVSTDAFALPPGGQWQHAVFDLSAAGMTQTLGTETLATVLSNVAQFRIISSADAAWEGDAIVATLGVDNITAVVTGDCDADGDVDLDNAATFSTCLSGPDAGLSPGCSCVNFDCDDDVDLRDFQALQSTYTGAP